VKFSKYADEVDIDLSFSLNVNFFFHEGLAKLLVILEHILEIVQKIVWLWEQKFLHYTSHRTVHRKLYKMKLYIVL